MRGAGDPDLGELTKAPLCLLNSNTNSQSHTSAVEEADKVRQEGMEGGNGAWWGLRPSRAPLPHPKHLSPLLPGLNFQKPGL